MNTKNHVSDENTYADAVMQVATVPDAARIFKMNPRTVRRWAEEGKIVAYQQAPGFSWIVSLPSVRKRVDKN